jgi:hypothetical protein
VIPLTCDRDGDAFRLPAPPPGPLHLLITLADGSCAWDVISHE